jgi:PAS domain S-box-containing protein
MRQALRRGLLGLPGHRLVPLIIFVMALLAIGLRYEWQMRHLAADVEQHEKARLLDRLSIEQSRLDVRLGNNERLILRRLVGSLGLHEGLDQAYLVDPGNQVLASLSRSDLGRRLHEVLPSTASPGRLSELLGAPSRATIQVDADRATGWLSAAVPLIDGHRLGVRVDIGIPLALRRQVVQQELAWEAVLALGAAGLLALLLHLLWFRRAQRLAGALGAMGAGDLSVRAGLDGQDELALIGRAADRMAQQLQDDRAKALHLSDLVNRSPLVVIEWRNAPGQPVHYVNDNIRQWGYDPESLVDGGVRFASLLHPDDAERVGEAVGRFLKHGPDEYHLEYRIIQADGSPAWVHDHTRQERDGQGRVVRISGILLDISIQKEAQQSQREQAELLRMFYELPFLGMAISSPADKRWLQVNDRLCDMLGYTRDELLLMSWAEMTPPGDLERNVALFDELLAGRRNGYRMAKRFVRKDGGIVHAEIDVRAVRDDGGKVKQLFATIQDVTERKVADEALRRSESLLLEAQRIGRMGSWAYDLRSGEVFWSEEAIRIQGLDPATFRPSFEIMRSLIHPDDLERVESTFQRAVEEGTVYETHHRIRLGDGRIKHLHVRGETQYEDGLPMRSVGMVVDETALVEAQRERDRLVSVMESTADIVSMADPQGRTFYFNRAGYEVLGLPPGPPDPGTIVRAHPEWASKRVLEEGFPAVMSTGRWLGETAIINAQGAEVPMSQLIMAHRDADGQIDYVWTILRDIAERKGAEEALNLERTRLAEAQAVARIGSWSVQMPGGEVSWSAQQYAVLGLDPRQVTPSVDGYLRVVHPDDLARVRAHVGRVVEHQPEGLAKIEHRIVTAQGVRHVEERASVERGPDGRVVRLFGTTMDVTERVLASQALSDLKDMLEQAETVSLLGSWAGDAQTQRLNVSAQLFRNLGLEPAARPPTDQQYLDRIHPDDRPRVIRDMRCIRDGGPPEDFVFRTNPLHGPVRWMRRTARRIDREAEGLKPRYIGTLLDITESVLAEEKLRQINQELEQRVTERTAQLSQANQELEAFSYTVSHDLKAPLRGIDGYSQLLVDEYGSQLDEEGRQFVHRIRQGVQQMGELISDLLEYSRMERRDMAPEPVALRPLVDAVLDGYHADIERQGAQVQVEMDDFMLALDREGISVVLRNLIGNALKFSRDSLPSQIEIGARLAAGRRVLWVRDNGVGFDMKYHDRMFGIFQRLHRAEEFAGTGVGLALVAKAVQRMGGRVWAESTVGAGATFYLEFPV